MSSKRILFTGRYETDYNRTVILADGLRSLNYEVIEYSFDKKNALTAARIRELSQDTLFTFLPCFTHKSVAFVKKHSMSPVVFDPLISKYVTNVLDYQHYGKWSYGALKDRFRDQTAVKEADFVIFDTRAHQDYFIKHYNLPSQKTGVVYLGSNTKAFGASVSTRQTDHVFTVGFVGGFIPLQGVFIILEAALRLKEFRFILIGDGFQFKAAQEFVAKHTLDNVVFPGRLPYEKLDDTIAGFDICLGIFGDNVKAHLVIPNKIFHYATCGKATITMDSAPIREIFTPDRDIKLCAPNPEALAESIKNLHGNPEKAQLMGREMKKLIDGKYNEKKVSRMLIAAFEHFKNKNLS